MGWTFYWQSGSRDDKFNASIGFDKRMWKEDIMVIIETLSAIYKSAKDGLLPLFIYLFI